MLAQLGGPAPDGHVGPVNVERGRDRLERTGGIMVYDISQPETPQFVTYANTTPTDLSPEGLIFIKRKDSPNGKPLLVVSHEVSNTVTIFEIEKDRQDDGDENDEDEEE